MVQFADLREFAAYLGETHGSDSADHAQRHGPSDSESGRAVESSKLLSWEPSPATSKTSFGDSTVPLAGAACLWELPFDFQVNDSPRNRVRSIVRALVCRLLACL